MYGCRNRMVNDTLYDITEYLVDRPAIYYKWITSYLRLHTCIKYLMLGIGYWVRALVRACVGVRAVWYLGVHEHPHIQTHTPLHTRTRAGQFLSAA